jgi:hypothetical protein
VPDVTLQPKKDLIHLGAKYNLAELNKKANNPMLKSSDVTFRIGIAKGALNTMIQNGLKRGAIGIEAAKFIVNAVILQKLTYGLSYAYTTKADEWRLEKVMADAARSIFGVDKKEEIDNKWIIRDTGMTNPMDIIKINDIKLIMAARQGKINTIVRDIILENAPKLAQRTEKTCEAWNVTMKELLHIHSKKLNKYLLQKAIERPLNLIHTNLQLRTEMELKINQARPTYETAGAGADMLPTYLETRAGLHWGNKGESTKCPYCPNNPQHTYIHCINECNYSLCAKVRKEHREALEQQGKQLIKASINGLVQAMTTESHKDLQYFLSMIASSPFL